MKIDPSAFISLELEKIFSIIRASCRSDLGASRLASARPAEDLAELRERFSLFAAVESYRDARGELPWSRHLSSVAALFDECKSSGMMTGEELLSVRHLAEGASRLRAAIRDAREEWPELERLARDLRDFDAEIAALAVIEDDGRLSDTASDRLRRVREKIRAARDAIRRKGAAILSDASLAAMLQERVVSLRHGRHVVLVRQDAVGSFPGAVMDRSSSGNSVYMEPHALVGPNNEAALLEEDERAEERRILHKLTETVLRREPAFRAAEDALGEVDLFYALSEKVRRDHWRVPELSDRSMIDFRRARHPLLGEAAVPIDIRCGEGFRSLVITGPNTGGKTVALKTAGVLAALAWHGWPIPAGDGSRVGVISDIMSDIGDEQSIEQSLSTFSAHVAQLRRIAEAAGGATLALLDELGAGTDPDEGAALGIAVLEWLSARGSLVLATTHHNPIKRYALAADGVETASVEFNAATLSPAYRLVIGLPGRSNAILIAERLGMPPGIIARAREAMHGREVSMEEIIGELHEKRAAIEMESAELDAERVALAGARERFERERRDAEARRDKLLAEADKKALGIVENAERSAKSLMKTMDAEAKSSASRKYGKSKKHFGAIRDSAERRDDARLERLREELGAGGDLRVGERVFMIGTATSGILEEIDGDKAVISSGAARVELPLKMLRRATPDEERDRKKAVRAGRKGDIVWSPGADEAAYGPPTARGPAVRINAPKAPTGVPSSIMIRGMTTDEALPLAERFLDQAFRAGYGEVSVIHGRGEGILRREIQTICKDLPYVEGWRLGEPAEGGHGVTVIRFKRR